MHRIHNVAASLSDRYDVDTVQQKAKVLRAHLMWLKTDDVACAGMLLDAERVRLMLEDMRLTPTERHAIEKVINPILGIDQ